MEKSTEENEQITIEDLNKQISALTKMIKDRDQESKAEFRISVVFVCFGFTLSYYSMGSDYISSALVFFILGVLLMFYNPLSKVSRRFRQIWRSRTLHPSED